MSISATARVTGHSRNTIARWLERASTAAEHFNRRMLRDFDIIELQADERCTFVGSKRRTLWLFATIVSVTDQPTESDAAALPTRCSPSAWKQAA